MTQNNIIEFLCGSEPFDGVWFGERHPSRRGVYWWRSELRKHTLFQAAQSGNWQETLNELQRLEAEVERLRAQIQDDLKTFREVDILDDPIGAAAQLESAIRNCEAALEPSR